MDEPDRSRGLLIGFLMAGGVVVVLGMIVFGGLLLARSSLPVAGPQGSVVYTLDRRAIPTVKTLSELFPTKLKEYTRKTLTGLLTNGTGSFAASYARGADTIQISGSSSVNYSQAQSEMEQLAMAAGLITRVTRLGSGFGYVLNVDKSEAVRLLYFHTTWMFNIRAPSRAALDAFMAVFQY